MRVRYWIIYHAMQKSIDTKKSAVDAKERQMKRDTANEKWNVKNEWKLKATNHEPNQIELNLFLIHKQISSRVWLTIEYHLFPLLVSATQSVSSMSACQLRTMQKINKPLQSNWWLNDYESHKSSLWLMYYDCTEQKNNICQMWS